MARLVHVSSDAVFSGSAGRYDETSPPEPTTPYGAAKAATVIARTSLIIGNKDSPHETYVHSLASGATTGVLFTDDVRCPVHVTDLASALLELASSPHSGVHHVAGADAVSRHELGVLIARRDGLDEANRPTGLRARTGLPLELLGALHLPHAKHDRARLQPGVHAGHDGRMRRGSRGGFFRGRHSLG